ncbi:MAG: hybrid sensor histidine kinase/response regulator [Candidatus Methylumidiphilus sp.]
MPISLSNWLAPKRFAPELERIYQNDLRHRLFRQVKIAIISGIVLTLIFTVLDIMDADIAPHVWKVRLVVLSLISSLVWFMHTHPQQAIYRLNVITIAMAAYALFALLFLSAMLMQGNIEHGRSQNFAYLEIFSAKMLEIIYVFGPLATPLVPAIVLCVISNILVFALGIYFGVSTSLQIEAMFDLFAILFIGALFRHQFESYTRQEFLDKRLIEEKRRAAEVMAQERARFLRYASHNLRQPLQVLMFQRDTLKAELGQSGEVPSSANAVFLTVSNLAKAFDSILDLSMLYDQGAKYQLSTIAVHDILENIERQYSVLAQSKQIKFSLNIRKTPLWAHSNGNLLWQIINNLVDNALKYTLQGQVKVVATQIRGTIKICVVDTGIGIDDKHKGELFKEFHRIENRLGISGLGIGLAFVQEALSRLGENHRLSWNSKVGKGSYFCMRIPASTALDAGASPLGGLGLAEEVEPVYDFGTGKMILLVDDRIEVLEETEKVLLRQGFEVLKAASATEARLVLEGHIDCPDVVITDYVLDDETAEDIVRCVQNLCGNIPIIVLSGEIKTGDSIAILGQTFMLLQKPINEAQLMRAIAKHIPSKPAEEAPAKDLQGNL